MLVRKTRKELTFQLIIWKNIRFKDLHRSSHREVFFKNSLNKLGSATLLKKRLWRRCFPVNFAKFLRTPFSIKHFRWFPMLLDNILKTSPVIESLSFHLEVCEILSYILCLWTGFFNCIHWLAINFLLFKFSKSILLFKKNLSHQKKSWTISMWFTLKEQRNFISRIICVRHYFVQYGFLKVCIFYRFLWKTSFLSFCAFCVFCLFCVEFDVTFHCLYRKCQVLCSFVLS